MLNQISQSDLVLTDSVGIQEECAVLNKPIFVLRNSTERPEILDNQSRVVTANFIQDLEMKLINFLTKAVTPGVPNLKLIGEYGSGKAGFNVAKFLIEGGNGKNQI
jgi:UDP-N-acetylglucosamine 2-epimerase (non-hydrolysing)